MDSVTSGEGPPTSASLILMMRSGAGGGKGHQVCMKKGEPRGPPFVILMEARLDAKLGRGGPVAPLECRGLLRIVEPRRKILTFP